MNTQRTTAFCGQIIAALLCWWALPAHAQQVEGYWSGGWLIPAGPVPVMARTGIGQTLLDRTGGLYVSGSFEGLAEFGSGQTRFSAGGSPDAFLAHYGPNGNCEWVLTSVTDGSSEGMGQMTLAPDDGVFISAGCSDSMQLSTGLRLPPAPHGRSQYLLRVSPTGSARLLRSFYSPGQIMLGLGYMKADSEGGLYFLGGGYGQLQVDTLLLNAGGGNNQASFVMRCDSSGAVRWVREFAHGTDPRMNLAGLAPDDHGGVFIGATCGNGPIDVGPLTIGAPLNPDVFVSHLSATGQWLWTQHVTRDYAGGGSLAPYRPNELTVTLNSNSRFTFAGYTSPALTGNQTRVTVVMRLDSTGAVQWTSPIYSTTTGTAALAVQTADSTGTLYAWGYGDGTVDIPNVGQLVCITPANRANGQLYSALVVRLDGATGQPQWALTEGGSLQTGFLKPTWLTCGTHGQLILSGEAYGTSPLGPQLALPTAPHGSDPFVAIIGQRQVTGLPTGRAAAGFTLAPNPARGPVWLTRQGASVMAAETATVIDAVGRVVRRQQLAAGQATTALDVTGLAPGLYVVRAGSAARRLVVE